MAYVYANSEKEKADNNTGWCLVEAEADPGFWDHECTTGFNVVLVNSAKK